MDLFTQGALGAALAQASTRTSPKLRIAGGVGFLAGLAPDLDALIRSPTDPLVFLEYHRHFTHALAFIPLGALACAGAVYAVAGRRLGTPFWQIWMFAAACVGGLIAFVHLVEFTAMGELALASFGLGVPVAVVSALLLLAVSASESGAE